MRQALARYFEFPDPGIVRATIRKDLFFPVGASIFIGGLMLWSGFGWFALAATVWINVIQFLTRWQAAKLGESPAHDSQRILVTLALAVLTSASYAMPGLLLIVHHSLSCMIFGFIWLFGVQLYFAGGFLRLPLFAIAMSAPLSAAMVIGMFEGIGMAKAPGTVADLPILIVVGIFYLCSNWIILRTQAWGNRLLVETQKTAAEQLSHLKQLHRVDPLTGLLNRKAIDEELQARLDSRNGHDVAVIVVDLSFLRSVNETYGHAIGDRILAEIAVRLRGFFEERAALGRLNGDSFVAAISFEGREDTLLTLARKLRDHLERPLAHSGDHFNVSAPIGIATTIGVPEDTVTALCAAADNAAQRARNTVERLPFIYNPRSFRSALTQSDRRLLIEGLRDGAILPHYQPKVHLTTGQIVGLEALARWNHPRKGVLPPGSFLPDIEALGLQSQLMEAMASRVMDDLGRMIDAGIDPGLVSINIPELALATNPGRTRLMQILNAAPHLRGHVTLEITEDVFIARAAKMIRDSTVALRALGLRISLDDFGTGFASFNHLKQLQFDELKIDRSFIADVTTDPRNEVLLQSLIGIAAGLGVCVMAEGVETEAQRHALLQMGCLSAQGYLFSPAIPLEEVIELMLRAQKEVEKTGRFTPFAVAQPLAVPAGQGRP